MKLTTLLIVLVTCMISGCDNTANNAEKDRAHLASLTCHSSKAGRSKQELQAIADACFKQGSYTKSSGKKW